MGVLYFVVPMVIVLPLVLSRRLLREMISYLAKFWTDRIWPSPMEPSEGTMK